MDSASLAANSEQVIPPPPPVATANGVEVPLLDLRGAPLGAASVGVPNSPNAGLGGAPALPLPPESVGPAPAPPPPPVAVREVAAAAAGAVVMSVEPRAAARNQPSVRGRPAGNRVEESSTGTQPARRSSNVLKALHNMNESVSRELAHGKQGRCVGDQVRLALPSITSCNPQRFK